MNIAVRGKWRTVAEPLAVKPLRLVATTLLSLLLPLSFLLISRLSSASFLFSLTKSQPQRESSFFFSIYHCANPGIVYVVVSSISVYTLILGLTSKIKATDPKRWIVFYPHVSIAWLTLFLVQITVGLGLEITTISNGFIIGSERNFLSRLVFFFGLHDVMFLWYRVIVRPVVDSTLLGGEEGQRREETVVERVALAVSCGTLWWWKLRDEVEALVGVADAKRALLLLPLDEDGNVNVNLEVGTVDFVNWWLYYMVVTIGMIRIVKGCLWFGMVLLFEQGSRRSPPPEISSNVSTPSLHFDDEEGDSKV